ncbi:protein O-mannosyl-transferase TMTC2-like [Gigantopelta aegis]|uniref:protein O-mannosyl-transferase TMTC2-like n=1 Tax=Gigantopelta aegis TaxID=1735272 RepID=UPI001B88833B|nr:protein O-mannosyl-transferase TMTC2-like [Gigantopelta aegis]
MDYSVVAASLAALGLYLNTLRADFAYDDSRAIQKNPDLLPETPLLNIFYDDFWGTPLTHSGSHKSYRPLCVLSFRLNHILGELDPWGYHLGNVLLHTLVTAVFTHLARIFLKRSLPTLTAGLLFASHPVHTEAVAGVVGRADVGACLFFLLAFLSYMKYVECRSARDQAWVRWWFMGAVYSFSTASMLTKEQGIAVLAVCAIYDTFIYNRVKLLDIMKLHILTMAKFWKLLEGLVLTAVCGGLLVVFRVYFMGNKPPEFAPSDNPASDCDSLLTRTLTYHFLPAFNVWLLFCPRVLSFDWSMEAVPLIKTFTDIRNCSTVLLYTALAYFAHQIIKSLHSAPQKDTFHKPHMNGNGVSNHTSHIQYTKQQTSFPKARLKTRRGSCSSTDSNEDIPNSVLSSQTAEVVILSLAIMVFPFIPASNLFFYVGFVIAERILYIPSMGFCLLVAFGADLLYTYMREKWKKRAVVVSIAIVILLYSARTVIRNEDWITEEKLYASGVSVNPAKAWGNLANVWNSQKKMAEAEEAYRQALSYRGNMADVHYNLAILLQEQKRVDEALESYKKAIHFRPKLSMAHLNYGILLASLGKTDQAAQVFRHCADLDTSGLKDPRLHDSTKISCLYNLGRQLTEQDRFEDALEVFHEALKRRPSYYQPQSLYNMLGEVYMKMGQLDNAEHWYHEALKSKPDHIPAHITTARLLQKKNKLEEAESWLKKAYELDPNDSSMLHHYAQFYAEAGRHKESLHMFKLALAKSKPDFELLFNAANAFRQEGDNGGAEGLYRQAVKLKPELSSAHMNLGAMLHMNNKLEEAETSYLEALRLKPDDNMTKTNLQKLRNLIGSRKYSTSKKNTR